MRTTKTEKARRAALLIAQGNKCALGKEPQSDVKGMHYFSAQNALLCVPCSTFVSSVRNAATRGVTPETLAAFLAGAPAAQPTEQVVKPEYSRLERERLVARLMAARGEVGNMTLADYDKRFGTSGPIIDPDTGLEWVVPSAPVWRDGGWVTETETETE